MRNKGEFLYSRRVNWMESSGEIIRPGARLKAERVRGALEWLFIAQVAWSIAVSAGLMNGPDRQWLDLLLLITAGLLAILSLVPELPLQNALAAAAALLLVSGALQALLLVIPFGQRAVGVGAGTLVLALSVVWTAAVVVCRGMAKQVLARWRQLPGHGYRLLSVTSLLVAVLWVWLDAFAENVRGYWQWNEPWRRDVVWRLLLWYFTAAVVQVAATPWLLRKKPGFEWQHASSVLVWSGMLVWLAFAEGLAGLWNYTWASCGAAALGPLLFIASWFPRRQSS